MHKLLAVSLLCCWGFALADTPVEVPAQAAVCAGRAYVGYVEAMSAWQRASIDALIAKRADLADIATLQGRSQILDLQRAAQRLKFLAVNDPNRLELRHGVAMLSSFNWTAQDEYRLQLAEPDYGQLTQQADQAEKQRRSNPRRGAMEQFVEKTFLDDANYLASLEPLAQRTGQADEALRFCQLMLVDKQPQEKRESSRIE